MRGENCRPFKAKSNSKRPNSRRETKQVLMQKTCISQNHIANERLIPCYYLLISPCVFEVVLRIAKYALYPLRKFLLPLAHVGQLVLVSDQPFQHPSCGGGKRVDRNRIAVIKPKKYCCRELASSNEFFANDNCVRWSELIVCAAHANLIRTMCARSSQAADQAGGQVS